MPLNPIPAPIIRTTTSASRFSFIAILGFLRKHWYLISFLIFFLPILIHSIQVAKQTNNPSYPFIETGITIMDADAQLDKEVNNLKNNPSETIGTKPESRLWNKVKYYWNLILVYWRIIGLLFLISLPFKLIYSYYTWRGYKGYDPSPGWKTWRSLWIGFLFIFFVNIILTIVYVTDGTLALSFTENSNVFTKSFIVIKNTIPFHGTFNLFSYLYQQVKI